MPLVVVLVLVVRDVVRFVTRVAPYAHWA
jgi:hypothetical protein